MRGMKTGGRQKGTPNKMTASAREAIEMAFDGLGGVPALTAWAKCHKTEYYTRIWPKLLPLQIGADAQSAPAITIQWRGEIESARETLETKLRATEARIGADVGPEQANDCGSSAAKSLTATPAAATMDVWATTQSARNVGSR